MVKIEIYSLTSITLSPTSTPSMLLNKDIRDLRKIREQCENTDKMKDNRIPVHKNV